VKTLVAKKDTLRGMELKLTAVVGMGVRPTSTTKHLKKGVVRYFLKKNFKRSFHINNTCRKPIYQKTGRGKSITPKPKRNRCMRKQSKTSFNQVTMLSFSSTILLICMWTRDTMCSPKLLEKSVEVAILAPPPIRLNMNNFMLEKTFNM
jgi:hypothetical protein